MRNDSSTLPLDFATRRSNPTEDLVAARIAMSNSGWFARAEMPEAWPLNLDDAVQLLSLGGEYEIDNEQLLDLIARRIIPRPGKDDIGDLSFDPFDFVQAARMLEARQLWRPTPSIHDPKKHALQIVIERARQSGEPETILHAPANLSRHDLSALLLMLTECDSREGRLKILSLTKATLECEHGVFLH